MDHQYSSRIQKIEAVLDKWLPSVPAVPSVPAEPAVPAVPAEPDPAWFRDVFSFPEKMPAASAAKLSGAAETLRSLTLPCRDLLSRGGKRWRPLLMALVCETLGGGDSSLPLSPLAEFCHNASLIHDDIEDNADQRRGKPAVHLLYGIDTAINSGSFLYFLPLSCIDSWAQGAPAHKVYSLWGMYMRRLHLGQSMDIAWHRDCEFLPAIDDYLVMCSLKTGCLARFSAVLGVCAAAAVNAEAAAHEDALAQMLGEAAEKIGVGFQILDDVKNLGEGLPGKKRGDDIVEGKKSLPVLLYLHRYPEQRGFVSRCFAAARAGGVGVGETEEFIQAIASAGILHEAREQGMELIAQAREVFNKAAPGGFKIHEEGRKLLVGLSDLIS